MSDKSVFGMEDAVIEIVTLNQELIAARDEAERLRARVAELEGQQSALQLSELMRGLEIGLGFATMPRTFSM